MFFWNSLAEDEMAEWNHWLNGRESQWTPGVGDGQGGLVCCDSWGCKESSDWATDLIWSEDGKGKPKRAITGQLQWEKELILKVPSFAWMCCAGYSVGPSETEQGPVVLAPCPMFSACLLSLENFSQSLVREMKNTETKENSQRIPNNNNVVIKHSQGPLVPSQGLQIIFWAISYELSYRYENPGGRS